jgi:hypothetical protein
MGFFYHFPPVPFLRNGTGMEKKERVAAVDHKDGQAQSKSAYKFTRKILAF